jgi:hypothetical protein
VAVFAVADDRDRFVGAASPHLELTVSGFRPVHWEAFRMGRLAVRGFGAALDPVRRACWAGSLTNGNESRRATRTEATLSPTCAALLLLSSRDNTGKAAHVAPDVRERGGQVPAASSRA